MTTINWKQIDTNGNGYVDGNEAAEAKKKGVKNVWNEMTEADYISNTTREQKLNALVPMHRPKGRQYVEIVQTVGNVDRNACVQEVKNNRSEEILSCNRKIEMLKKEYDKVLNKFRQKYNILDYARYDIKNFFNSGAEGGACGTLLSIFTFGLYDPFTKNTEKHDEYNGYRAQLSVLSDKISELYTQMEAAIGYYSSL